MSKLYLMTKIIKTGSNPRGGCLDVARKKHSVANNIDQCPAESRNRKVQATFVRQYIAKI